MTGASGHIPTILVSRRHVDLLMTSSALCRL